MATQFTINTGYRGVVKLENAPEGSTSSSSDNMITLLATSGQFQQNHQPIFSSGVWGAGYYNIAEQVAYANDFIRLEGSLGCEFTAGPVFEAIHKFAFTNRGAKNGTGIEILPQGLDGFIGRGWCTSLSFSANQNAVLTGDMNFSSYLDGVMNKIIAEGKDIPTNDTWDRIGSHDPENFEYNGLYPYWGCNIYKKTGDNNGEPIWDTSPMDDIMSWSASYSSSLEMLKCCGMKPGAPAEGGAYSDKDSPYYDESEMDIGAIEAPLAPDYVGLGPMSAECSMEVFKLAGDFADVAFHLQKGFKFRNRTPQPLKDGDDSYIYDINIPIVVCSNNSSQIQTGTGWITASFSYTAIGDRKKPPMSLEKYIEEASGSGSGSGSGD